MMFHRELQLIYHELLKLSKNKTKEIKIKNDYFESNYRDVLEDIVLKLEENKK